jgi:hypothetical protein
LEEIEEFVVAEDCGEELDAAALPAKLASDLVPGAERGELVGVDVAWHLQLWPVIDLGA